MKIFTYFWSLVLILAVTMPSTVVAADKLNRAEVEAWANDYYGRAVAEKRNAAITISVVQDGEVLFQKGYGYQDYGKNIPADAITSGFSVGSITKTFVATSIAQLIDRGLIDSINDPANKYLTRVQIPDDRGDKITLSYLLNHRAGFANVDFGYLSNHAEDIEIPLTSKEIMRFMPDVVMEPGGRAVYSNWSFSLLGFLIEDVTGERLDDYLKKNIFTPLGMSHTSLMYGSRAENWSKPYLFTKSGEAVSKPSPLPHPWIGPAGTIISTSADMARYMNAHLFEGRDGGAALVSDKMFNMLHKESYRNGVISIGFAHTFWTSRVDDTQTIEHGGGTPAFQSMMVMIPEYKIGFFASAMQSGLVPWEEYSEEELAGEVVVREPMGGYELRESFVERFFPQEITYPSGPKSDLSKLVGSYYTALRAYTTVEALGDGFNPASVLTISLSEGGDAILMSGRGPYREIGNGVFENVSGESRWINPYSIDLFSPQHISFNLADNGTVIDLIPGLADQVWQPVSSIFNPHTMVKWLFVLGLVAGSGLLIFLWPSERRFSNAANQMAALLALTVMVFPYSMIGGFSRWDDFVAQMSVGNAGRLWVLVITSNAILVLGLLMLWQCFKRFELKNIVGTSWGETGRKAHLSVLVITALLLVLALNQFNLIGFNIPG